MFYNNPLLASDSFGAAVPLFVVAAVMAALGLWGAYRNWHDLTIASFSGAISAFTAGPQLQHTLTTAIRNPGIYREPDMSDLVLIIAPVLMVAATVVAMSIVGRLLGGNWDRTARAFAVATVATALAAMCQWRSVDLLNWGYIDEAQNWYDVTTVFGWIALVAFVAATVLGVQAGIRRRKNMRYVEAILSQPARSSVGSIGDFNADEDEPRLPLQMPVASTTHSELDEETLRRLREQFDRG